MKFPEESNWRSKTTGRLDCANDRPVEWKMLGRLTFIFVVGSLQQIDLFVGLIWEEEAGHNVCVCMFVFNWHTSPHDLPFEQVLYFIDSLSLFFPSTSEFLDVLTRVHNCHESVQLWSLFIFARSLCCLPIRARAYPRGICIFDLLTFCIILFCNQTLFCSYLLSWLSPLSLKTTTTTTRESELLLSV